MRPWLGSFVWTDYSGAFLPNAHRLVDCRESWRGEAEFRCRPQARPHRYSRLVTREAVRGIEVIWLPDVELVRMVFTWRKNRVPLFNDRL